jgi:hypothetical protein
MRFVAAVLLLVPIAFAQTFEVVSIKPSDPARRADGAMTR